MSRIRPHLKSLRNLWWLQFKPLSQNVGISIIRGKRVISVPLNKALVVCLSARMQLCFNKQLKQACTSLIQWFYVPLHLRYCRVSGTWFYPCPSKPWSSSIYLPGDNRLWLPDARHQNLDNSTLLGSLAGMEKAFFRFPTNSLNDDTSHDCSHFWINHPR